MSSTLPLIDQPGDAELISAVRGGDVDAYGLLFERHVDAARRLARQLVPGPDADDLVSDAFAKVLGVLQRGGGPDVAFRAYLLTSVRSLGVDRFRATSRVRPTDDLESIDAGVPFRDTAVEGFENAAAARAFASLPERWQLVLWHTEVEGQKPAEVAPLLGMTPNSVSALAYRAREGLRQAFLTEHAAAIEGDTCKWTHQNLGAYIRSGTSRRDSGKVESHLQECRKCMAIYLELAEVNSNLSGILAPLLLGGLAAGYLSGTAGGTAVAAGGLLGVFGRVRDLILGNVPAATAAGVAIAGVTTTAVVMGMTADSGRLSGADQPLAPAAISPSGDAGGDGGDGSGGSGDGSDGDGTGDLGADPLGPTIPAVGPSELPTSAATTDPSGTTESTGSTESTDPTGSTDSDVDKSQDPSDETDAPDESTAESPTKPPSDSPSDSTSSPTTPDPTTPDPTTPDPTTPDPTTPDPTTPDPTTPDPTTPDPTTPDPTTPDPTTPDPTTPDPTTPDPTIPVADVAVTASYTLRLPLTWDVTVRVSGLPAGAQADLAIDGSQPLMLFLFDDVRCDGGFGDAECTIDSSGTPWQVDFLTLALSGNTITFVVTSDDVADPDLANNRFQLRLN